MNKISDKNEDTVLKRNVLLGASLACANFLNLEKEIKELEASGIDYIHYDVMDGHFVPNYALNVDLINTIKAITPIPLNVHLMTTNPSDFLDVFIEAGVDSLSFHQEITPHVQRLIDDLKACGIQAGLALNPATPLNVLDIILPELDFILIMTVNPGFSGQKLAPSMIKKIADCQKMINDLNLDIPIQVDGNVSFENIPAMVKAGASMLVGGTSSIFVKDMKIIDAVQKTREIINKI